MEKSDVVFIYEHKVLPQDKSFIDKFKIPASLSSDKLSSLENSLYEFERIKRTVFSFGDLKNNSILSFKNVVLEKERLVKEFISSSLFDISSSSSSASKNLNHVSSLHRVASIINYSSPSLKNIESIILDSASKQFSSKNSLAKVYFNSDSLIVSQQIPERIVEKTNTVVKIKEVPKIVYKTKEVPKIIYETKYVPKEVVKIKYETKYIHRDVIKKVYVNDFGESRNSSSLKYPLLIFSLSALVILGSYEMMIGGLGAHFKDAVTSCKELFSPSTSSPSLEKNTYQYAKPVSKK